MPVPLETRVRAFSYRCSKACHSYQPMGIKSVTPCFLIVHCNGGPKLWRYSGNVRRGLPSSKWRFSAEVPTYFQKTRCNRERSIAVFYRVQTALISANGTPKGVEKLNNGVPMCRENGPWAPDLQFVSLGVLFGGAGWSALDGWTLQQWQTRLIPSRTVCLDPIDGHVLYLPWYLTY